MILNNRFAVCLLLPLLGQIPTFAQSSHATTQPGQPRNVDTTRAKGVARQLALDRESSNLAVRASTQGKRVSDLIPVDLDSNDKGRIDEALALLIEATNANSGEYCRANLKSKWMNPLLRLKKYEILQSLINKALSDGYLDTRGISQALYCQVKLDINDGKLDDALVNGKIYYNFCLLEESDEAITTIAEILANSKFKEDDGVVHRFVRQQEVELQTRDPNNTKVHEQEENILKTVKLDDTKFHIEIDKLEKSFVNYSNLTAKGNLLLIAGRSKEAKAAFERAVDLAQAGDLPAAISNVARSIRADNELVGPANEYIKNLQQQK